jgi:leader peptidase (prepilin peptidase)/N-methyltransferase
MRLERLPGKLDAWSTSSRRKRSGAPTAAPSRFAAVMVESGLVLLVVIAAAGGLLVGSFLNVVAWRLPRGESLVAPGSHCPGCEHPVRPYDNVPVLSWLALRGRCRDCRTPISVRYPLVEALTAALAAAVVLTNDGLHDTLLGLALVALLVPIALIDLDHRIIPNRLTALGALVALVIGLATDPGGVPQQLIAGAAAAGFLLLAALARPGGMGMGDVKLAGVLGLFLGREVAVALLVALVAGTAVGIAVMARKGAAEGRKTAIPFGPFLALGGAVAVLAGPAIVDWYLSTIA